MTRCAARQYSDEMHCPVCRLRWDTNDIDPPACKRKTQSGVPTIKAPSIVSAEVVIIGVDYGSKPAKAVTVVATRAANEKLPFVSALAPDPFSRK